MESMNVMKKLALVQKELKVPKSQHNNFGNYDYRSCEDILEVAKPLCVDNGLSLTLSDDIRLIGERFYVVATATVTNNDDPADFFSTYGFAREEEQKKGMDSSQITGSASSYARKYALNGLFCIDDTTDSDSANNGSEAPKKAEPKKAEPKAEPKKVPKPGESDAKYICAKCGKPIFTADEGKAYKGVAYCNDCYDAIKALVDDAMPRR